jgi:hypothetical protein
VQQNAPNDNPDAYDGRYGDRRSPGLGHLIVITRTGGRCAKQHQPDNIQFGYFRLVWVQQYGHFVLFWVLEKPKCNTVETALITHTQ